MSSTNQTLSQTQVTSYILGSIQSNGGRMSLDKAKSISTKWDSESGKQIRIDPEMAEHAVGVLLMTGKVLQYFGFNPDAAGTCQMLVVK